ncbi:MAG: threonine--tRNA ligase [Alphaproteobacteria bacterium]|jgi:threonyl-tRNA synthetase|nr:threonine--tRNA ligase [Alphaproteobacteria bacterium]
MIKITLLDGSSLDFENPPSGMDVAMRISPNLAKNAYACYVNGELWDIKKPITENSKVEIITNKNVDVVLDMLRHDMAHLLGEAIMELFPDTQLATGPTTENGFFYDSLPPHPFSSEDLQHIEEKMKEIIDRGEEVESRVISRTEAMMLYKAHNQNFKVEILQGIEDDYVSFYKQGNFDDLCRGPHINNTCRIPKSFKLTKVSGVYWQGDSQKPMLQRVYGVGFLTQKDLDAFLILQEELEKNDHRKLGKELDLFHMQEEAVGAVFWHDKGWRIYRTLENYIRSKLQENGYGEVKTPILLDRSLWEASGHWDKFGENMFVINNNDNTVLALKPMNCPAHIQIFKQGQKSYRDLPLRMAEFGCCHRNEPSGALHGIMRVRAFTQDDAHIFCTEEQIISETVDFCHLLKEIYAEVFGDIEIIVKFSDRPAKRAGSDEVWDASEKALHEAARSAGLDPILNKGEGAFYGPKLEFAIKDSLGRDWQLGTLQSDFVLPSRLGAFYIGEDGNKKAPVMLHRAILGSLERFIGILIEHYKGKLPLWLAPTQVSVMTISNKFDSYATQVADSLRTAGINVELDKRDERINYKIREHTLNKVPLMLIIGEKEESNKNITLRILGEDKQETLSLDNFTTILKENIDNKNIIFKI